MEDIFCISLFLSLVSSLCPMLLNTNIIQSAASAALYFYFKEVLPNGQHILLYAKMTFIYNLLSAVFIGSDWHIKTCQCYQNALYIIYKIKD